MKVCKVCGTPLIEDRGSPTARFLVVGEFPGDEEIRSGSVLVGRTGELLKNEMMYARMDYTKMLYTNLWQHKPLISSGTDIPKEEKARRAELNRRCLEPFIGSLFDKMNKVDGALLMGSDAINTLTTYDTGVMSVSNLDVKDHLIYPTTCKFVIAMPNPAQAFHQSIGEVRLALERFKERMEKCLAK